MTIDQAIVVGCGLIAAGIVGAGIVLREGLKEAVTALRAAYRGIEFLPAPLAGTSKPLPPLPWGLAIARLLDGTAVPSPT